MTTTTTTAKVFIAGNSQAVRLPKAFRVQARQMWISKNEVTGEITLKPKDEDRYQDEISALMNLVRSLPFETSFIAPRDDTWRPSPFEDGLVSGPSAASAPRPRKRSRRPSTAA
ncbi:MAG: hypothetical protein LBH31_10440 [Burkholderiaceae bacterium]|nr:hypothetical protein [Burkholderiaceae bacterium]